MQEWLALLLPVAAASGWYAAKQHYTKKYLIDHTQTLRQAYCRGLNYLLSEKTDKAIDTFADLLARDYETIETHIALGNLFRRRGEIEKAIAIHEKLINQDNLNEEQRAGAHFELGLDYLSLGLFDRAESIFKNLLDCEAYRKSSLQQLLQIYQHEKDWRKAIECTRKLQRMGRVQRNENVAQFLCELAQEALEQNLIDKACKDLDRALKEDPKCARASLLKARMQMQDGHFDLAIQALKNVESQDSAYIPEILEPLQICHERLNKPSSELTTYLAYLYETFSFEDAAIFLAGHFKLENSDKAAQYLQRVLDDKPSMKVLRVLADLLHDDGAAKQQESLARLGRTLEQILSVNPRYRCVQCGFSGTELHWRCPYCQYWESTRPIETFMRRNRECW